MKLLLCVCLSYECALCVWEQILSSSLIPGNNRPGFLKGVDCGLAVKEKSVTSHIGVLRLSPGTLPQIQLPVAVHSGPQHMLAQVLKCQLPPHRWPRLNSDFLGLACARPNCFSHLGNESLEERSSFCLCLSNEMTIHTVGGVREIQACIFHGFCSICSSLK